MAHAAATGGTWRAASGRVVALSRRADELGVSSEVDGGLSVLEAAFDRAAARCGRFDAMFRIGGQRCRVVAAGTRMFDLLVAPLRHLEVADGVADFTLLAWDRHSTGEALPRCEGRDVRVPGDPSSQGATDGVLALRQLDQGTFSAYAPGHRLGVFWADDLRACDRVLPLRLFLHWWMAPLGLTLVHAGAVGSGGRGVLVTGAGGRGKSTSCVSALVAGLDYAGDDFVLVDMRDDDVVAHSVSCSARFTAQSFARVPAVAGDVADAGPAVDGKRFLVLHPRWRTRLVPSIAIDALVIPFIVPGSASRVVAISPGEALRAMVSTLVAMVGDRDEAFRRLAALARRRPCYRLEAGSNSSGVTDVLLALVSRDHPSHGRLT